MDDLINLKTKTKATQEQYTLGKKQLTNTNELTTMTTVIQACRVINALLQQIMLEKEYYYQNSKYLLNNTDTIRTSRPTADLLLSHGHLYELSYKFILNKFLACLSTPL